MFVFFTLIALQRTNKRYKMDGNFQCEDRCSFLFMSCNVKAELVSIQSFRKFYVLFLVVLFKFWTAQKDQRGLKLMIGNFEILYTGINLQEYDYLNDRFTNSIFGWILYWFSFEMFYLYCKTKLQTEVVLF